VRGRRHSKGSASILDFQGVDEPQTALHGRPELEDVKLPIWLQYQQPPKNTRSISIWSAETDEIPAKLRVEKTQRSRQVARTSRTAKNSDKSVSGENLPTLWGQALLTDNGQHY